MSLRPEEHFKLVEATLICQGLRDVTWWRAYLACRSLQHHKNNGNKTDVVVHGYNLSTRVKGGGAEGQGHLLPHSDSGAIKYLI